MISPARRKTMTGGQSYETGGWVDRQDRKRERCYCTGTRNTGQFVAVQRNRRSLLNNFQFPDTIEFYAQGSKNMNDFPPFKCLTPARLKISVPCVPFLSFNVLLFSFNVLRVYFVCPSFSLNVLQCPSFSLYVLQSRHKWS